MSSSNPYLALVARLETRDGAATIKGPNGEDSNNLFNIKETRKGRVGYKALDKVEGSNDAYRVYASREEGEADMTALLQRRYPQAYAAMSKPWSPESVQEFAEGLKAGGYATDPKYVSKLVSVAQGIDPAKLPAPRKGPVARAIASMENQRPSVLAGAKDLTPGLQTSIDALKIRQDARPSIPEMAAAAITGNTDFRIADILRGVVNRPAPQEGFQVPTEDLLNVEGWKAQQRAEARSQQELDEIKAHQQEDDERVQVLADRGVGPALGLGLAAELLSVTNVAVARATGPGVALARVGRNVGSVVRKASLARNIGTNVATGAGLELALQKAEGRVDPGDLLLNASADVLLGGLGYGLEVRALNMHAAKQDALARELDLIDRATQQVGEAASPEQLQIAMQNLRSQEIKAPLTDGVAAVSPERRLLDTQEEVLEEVPVPVASQAPTSFSNPLNTLEDVDNAWAKQDRWEDPALAQGRVAAANQGTTLSGHIQTMTNGELDWQAVKDLPAGVHATEAVNANPQLKPFVKVLKALAAEYLPKHSKLVVGDNTVNAKHQGEALSIGNAHIVSLQAKNDGNTIRLAEVTMHELGHAVFHQWASKVPVDLMQRLDAEFLEFARLASAGDPRAGDIRHSAQSGWIDRAGQKVNKTTEYYVNRDEWFAENFVKHLQKRLAEEETKLPKGVIDQLIMGFKNLFKFFMDAKRADVVNPAATVEEFAREVLKRTNSQTQSRLAQVQTSPAPVGAPQGAAIPDVNPYLTDPVAIKYGLGNLPLGTAAERADAQHILNLYKKAEDWAVTNPKDAAWDKRAQQLIDNSLLPAASTGLRLLKSENPVARMLAAELLEDASGVAGQRRSTAAISKYLHEQKFLGNTVLDVQNNYSLWRKASGGSIADEYIGGEYWSRFNRLLAEEIEARNLGKRTTDNPYVKAAADSLEGAYDRIRVGQIDNKTLGYQALGDTSRGYMPHKISPSRWLATTNEQRQAIHTALVDQFTTIEGWDTTFADNLAAKYLERVQARATGGHDSPIGGNSAGSAEIIEDALAASGMSPDEVRKNMQRFNRGAATWTKGRIKLDLTAQHGDGFTLLDVFETDQIALLRSQAGRASGEVALARHGVMGRPGLQVLRKAMTYGEDGKRATNQELEAFDQVSAEFMSAPFGTAEPKWMENARTMNSLVRLGGIVFNQFAEFVNGITHVGVGRTLAGVASVGRMRQEIKAKIAGKPVENGLLDSIELLGGADFGTQAYKVVLPWDSPDHAYPTYGRDTVTNFDRLLRGASYAQSKLSLWRTVHSVQQRAMAEQIVAKIARYSRDGQEDVALDQFGVSKAARAAIVNDGVARWEGNSLVEFDVTKIKDTAVREELIQAVHRGVSQIIQGTFIGETGKWAHDGYLKMLTQFRTFSLTSMEKQWARQRNSRGTAQALGILLGSAAAVTPIYMARVYANSVGREDQEEYLEQRLDPAVIARQSLNYIALAGLAGDFFDAAATLAPEEWDLKKAAGGRSGTDTEFVGNVVAPALSLVDDGWAALQNLDDPEKLARMLPGSRLPYLLPAINALGD